MLTARRPWTALVIPALALLPVAGCFESATPSELSCTQSKYCPGGHVCVGAQPGSPGRCQKSGDGVDGQANTDARVDSPVPPSDGPMTSTDAATSDLSNQPDTASDVPASADLGYEVASDAQVSPLDTSADNTAPLPDLGPDQKPDVPPDLPHGPEVGPDAAPTECMIGGTTYASGAPNPANTCQICRPTASASSWSNSTDDTTCGAGRICTTGKCQCPSSAPNLCDTCVNTQTDASNCGGCNVPCGANRSCSAGACQCLGQKFSCGTCASWNFESNRLEGWTGTDPYGLAVFGSPAVVPTPGSPSFGGTYSLAFPSSYGKQPAVFVNLCGSGGTTTDVSGFSISMYFDGPAYPGGIDLVKLHDTTGADLVGAVIPSPTPGTWFTVTSTFSTVAAQYLEIDVIPTSGPWSGTVYVDNVQFMP